MKSYLKHISLTRIGGYFLLVLMQLWLLSACSRSHNSSQSVAELYDEVDVEIGKRQEYMSKKEAKIDKLCDKLDNASDLREKYDLTNRLIDEYEAYISDSALNYIYKAQDIAASLGDVREQTRMKIKEADVASHAGLFAEAHDLLSEIDHQLMDSTLLTSYYAAYCNLYQYEVEYQLNGEYSDRAKKLRDSYIDSLLLVTPKDAFEYIINSASREINSGNIEKAKQMLDEKLRDYNPGTRQYSILTSIIAYLYKSSNDKENHHRYLAITVISDIRGAVKENMAIRELATEVFEDGDIDRANRYLKVSFDDANFYSARMRNAQSSRMLPIIDKAYDTRQHEMQSRLRYLLYGISALFLIVAVGSVLIHKQKKRISEANHIIEKSNNELSDMSERLKNMNAALEKSNSALEDSNRALAYSNSELTKSNRVTGEYVRLFMEYCSLNIFNLQKYHMMLRNLAKQGNVKEVLKKLDSNDVAVDTLKAFYSKFDEAILSIFPSFVERVNELLQDDGRIVLKVGEKLNTELRILALIRIGINDSDKIADFLRCSLSTIYTYRSKLKRRAKQPDIFETQILEM